VAAEVERAGATRGVFVEVGTAYGGLALAMLELHEALRVVAVDPFLGGYDARDSMSDLFRDLPARFGAAFPALWARALYSEARGRFGCRYELMHNTSVAAAAARAPASVDLVFIDGDHTREAVAADIAAWARVLKKGGAFCFNDYQARWPGVVAAVDEYARATMQELRWLRNREWGNVGLDNLS